MTDRVTTVTPDRYLWALKRAGLTKEEYISLHHDKNLSKWISGEKFPTVIQLQDFANKVHVPCGFLLMENPPKEDMPFTVFRGNIGLGDHFNLNVYDTVCIVKNRQNWLEDYLVENELDTCEFIGSIDLHTSIEEAVDKLRDILKLDTKWAFKFNRPEKGVNAVTQALENAGVFVAYNGIVGNNTTRHLEVSECRGFALVNKTAPYIFVNSNDAPTAQLFTLIHETAHLMLGQSAGHAGSEIEFANNSNATERYCDMLAAEFLVPQTELKQTWNGNGNNLAELAETAHRFLVSEAVIIRRLHDLQMITDELYNYFWQHYFPKNTRKSGKGGDFYRTSLKRVGRLFATHVKNAVASSQLTYLQAYRLTGLFGKTYTTFMDANV